MANGFLRLSLAAALLLALAGCGDADQRRLTLTGSSTVAPLATELAHAFEAQHPEVRIDVQAGGSSRGLADARQGLNDAGMVSRALTAAELEELRSHTIARDGIALVVHADNPVEELDRGEIRSLYTGGVTSWSAVGGPDAPVTVVNKAAGRATLEVFLEEMELKASAVEADVIVGHNEQAIKTVARNPNALGYVSIGAARYHAERDKPIRLLPLDGVEPTPEAVAAGRFPMSRPLKLVTTGPPSELLRRFIHFATETQKGRKIVREQLFIPVGR